MAVQAVIFDWGGTLTPWHTIDHSELWLSVCVRHYPATEAALLAAAVRAAETEMWQLAERSHLSSTLEEVFARGPHPELRCARLRGQRARRGHHQAKRSARPPRRLVTSRRRALARDRAGADCDRCQITGG